MNKWTMAPTDYVDNIHMSFPHHWCYKYEFCVVTHAPEGTLIIDDSLLPMDSKIIEFLKPFDRSKYSLHTEWATNKIDNVHLFDLLHCFGTNDKELATLFKLTWC